MIFDNFIFSVMFGGGDNLSILSKASFPIYSGYFEQFSYTNTSSSEIHYQASSSTPPLNPWIGYLLQTNDHPPTPSVKAQRSPTRAFFLVEKEKRWGNASQRGHLISNPFVPPKTRKMTIINLSHHPIFEPIPTHILLYIHQLLPSLRSEPRP